MNNNDTMSDDEVVASYVLPRYLFPEKRPRGYDRFYLFDSTVVIQISFFLIKTRISIRGRVRPSVRPVLFSNDDYGHFEDRSHQMTSQTMIR